MILLHELDTNLIYRYAMVKESLFILDKVADTACYVAVIISCLLGLESNISSFLNKINIVFIELIFIKQHGEIE